MSQDLADISWSVLRQIVQDWAGPAADLKQVKTLVGGCINTTLQLSLADGGQAVLKISPHRVNLGYAEEAHQLVLLRAAGLPVPDVYRVFNGSLEWPFSYLLMEFVDGVNLAQARKVCSAESFDVLQGHLGELVAQMHGTVRQEYGRVSSQDGPTFESWPAFYHAVYDPILHEAEKSKLLPVRYRKQINKVHDKLDRLLAHADCPRLVHWDLWATNLLARPDDHGDWRVVSVLDPNCKFAHCEAELAYMELFHTITPSFMKSYQQDRKLPPEYHRLRKPIYQLYSLLNHINLFGADYLPSLMQVADRVGQVA